MIPIITSQLTANRCSTTRRVSKSLMILSVIGCVLACVSCQEQGPPLVDTTPLGDGLKVIAYAVLGVGVLGVLGKIVTR
jgi:hypothetical protein